MKNKIFLKWQVKGQRKDFVTNKIWKLFLLPLIGFLLLLPVIFLRASLAGAELSTTVKVVSYIFLVLVVATVISYLVFIQITKRTVIKN